MTKQMLSAIYVSVLFSASVFAQQAEQKPSKNDPKYHFGTQKIVDEHMGAWKNEDGRCLLFFFTDQTVLQIYFGETTIGFWRYTSPDKKRVEFMEEPDSKVFRPAVLERDSLFIDQGDYANKMTRLKLHRTPSEKGE